jgi:UDP-N-acetylmuramate dehydrogenase
MLLALQQANLSVSLDANLSRRSWWRAGGPADGFVTVKTHEQLSICQASATAHHCPLFVVGNGSNLLISDRGIRGLVLRLAGDLARIEATEDDLPRIHVGGGARLVSLMKQAVRENWTGFEQLTGIPGTMGGAVRMNAGTHMGEVSDALESVDLALPDGTFTSRTQDQLGLGYRQSELPEGCIVARATLRTTGGDAAESALLIQNHLDYRTRTQPVDVPTCGSTFRNPPGEKAGRLIEQCGLKGHRIGGAEVSTKHANFLVNTGAATAVDLRRLIEHVQSVVEQDTGVQLQREVHFAGDWSHWNA